MEPHRRRHRLPHIVDRLPLPATVRSVVDLAWSVVQAYGAHRGGEAAAAIAYYSLFSLFPLALFLMAVLGYLAGSTQVQEDIIAVIGQLLPGSEEFISSTLHQVSRAAATIGLVAAVGLLWSASGAFSALAAAINRAHWAGRGRPFWQEKLVSIALTLAVGALLVLAIVSSSVAQLVGRYGKELLPQGLGRPFALLDTIGFALAVVTNVTAFTILYRWLPVRRVPWRAALTGGAVAGGAWEIAKGVFAWYLSTFAASNFRLVYGPVGAVLALLLWIYVSAVIIIFGAELSAAIAIRLRAAAIERGKQIGQQAQPTASGGG